MGSFVLFCGKWQLLIKISSSSKFKIEQNIR